VVGEIKTMVVVSSIVVSALALRGAWVVLMDAAELLMPFLIMVDAAGR
jgi:hypothetical protein